MRTQRKNVLCLIVLILVFVTSAISAQSTSNYRGTVKDAGGEPLIGVSVLVKGTTSGVITNLDGEYSIHAKQGDVLVFSYVGMNAREVALSSQLVNDVILTEEAKGLDEIVVIGYGVQKRGDLTTAVSSVSTEDLDMRPITSAAQAIQGKAAGVQVIQPNGRPGAGMVIRVRGTTSMNASNDPLYVVDGVPMNNIDFLSANDIESMQIMKDASSAAIYGSRGANGVVMITTKATVPKDRSSISFSTYRGITNISRRIESLNLAEYKEYLSDLQSSVVLPDGLTDQTNWFDETFTTGIRNNYQLSASGTSNKVNYFLSGGYTDETGIINTTAFKRFNFRSAVDAELFKWLTVSGNISYSNNISIGDIISGTGSNRGGVILSVINTPTYAPIWDTDNPKHYYNRFFGVSNITHPLENLARTKNNKHNTHRLLATGKSVISFMPDLKLSSSITGDMTYYNYTSFLDPISTSYGRGQFGEAQDNRSFGAVMMLDNILTYNKKINLHSFEAMAGTSYTVSDWSESYQFASHFANDLVQTLNAANKISPGNGTTASQWAIMSYLGRISYNYDSKYLATFNVRADGSSKLAPSGRWGYFPSFSAAWRASSEKFLADVHWLDDLKLRAGWGQTGNQDGLGDYAYLERYNFNRIEWWKPGQGDAVPTYSQASLSSSDLTWETTTQTNIGLDLTMFQSRLTMNLDYYFKRTTDMLMWVTLPAGSAAVNSIQRNEGEMTNRGVELSVSSKNFVGDFKWSTDFNISHNKNRLESLVFKQVYYDARVTDILSDYAVKNMPGRPLGGFWGYESTGVDPETGELIYVDKNNDDFINASDRTYIGDPNPDFTFGMTNIFSYKNFNLSILLQGTYGNDIFNVSRIESEGMYDAKNQSKRVIDRWRRPGMITSIPKAGYDMKISSYFVEDGSYLRIKDVTLSYDFDMNWMKKVGIRKIQPYATVTNLFTFTKYLGFDPEVNQWGNSGNVQGIDYGTYPQTRSFIVGLNIEI
ncbi:MAG: Vitamin B12 transporter BtuB [Bacteroidetes bacterium ADurb.Bin174]|jgi:TonB-linked SusC/RagA family outer membrane protein|nr:MAG: Vitamin B12 transporter BtuB [Bacteroidetes bacterium ADurb.Bin174]